jgi:hypothetical protein
MRDPARPFSARLETVIVDRLKVAAQGTLPPSVAQSVNVHAAVDRFTQGLVFQLSAYVLAQHLDSHTVTRDRTVTFDVPATWFQHWKQHAALRDPLARWLVRRWPVRTRTLTERVELTATWDRYAAFPEATIITDDRLGQSLRWLRADVTLR